MPLIQVLPNTTTTNAPGWAYVPDTGYDPSKAAIQPSGSRQRAARNVVFADGQELTARQQNAINKHLAELDKENHRDVNISIPTRHKDGPGKVTKAKTTQNVRRILQSQKTFANHLADEEAHLISQSQSTSTEQRSTVSAQSARKGIKGTPSASRRRSTTMTEGPPPSTRPASPVPTQPSSQLPASAGPSQTPLPRQVADTTDPLLQSYTPANPPAQLIQDLLAMPALSYAAARSKPSSSGVPQRHFCEICGYWGRVRCKKCNARVCGLECKGVHDEQRCLKFYA